MLSCVKGRIAIVTGGASGMGAACARLLSGAGARVVIVDRDGVGAANVAAGIGATVVAGDVTDSAFCDHAVAETLDRHGRVNALVNAAGTIVRADALGTDDEAWHRQFRVNVDGTFFMSRAAVRVMKPVGSGAIVNFGSIWGGTGGQGHTAYCAAQVMSRSPLPSLFATFTEKVRPITSLPDGTTTTRRVAASDQVPADAEIRSVALPYATPETVLPFTVATAGLSDEIVTGTGRTFPP